MNCRTFNILILNFRFAVLAGLCFALPGNISAQYLVNEVMSNGELYRQIIQLQHTGEYSKAAEAYRIIAERDLAEIENLDRAIKNYIEAQKLFEKAGDSVRIYQTVHDLGRLYSGREYYLEA